MLRSTIITNARKIANDTDTSTPFHTDTECHALIDAWEREVRRRIKRPKLSQSISLAQGDGPQTAAKALTSTFLCLTRAVLIPLPATQYQHKVIKIVEEEAMDDLDPAWRDRTDQAQPSRVVLVGAVTAAAAEYSAMSAYVDRACDQAYTLRLEGVELPAASTDGTKSPAVPGVFHTSAQFYLASYMLLPRNAEKSDSILAMFEREFRRAKGEGAVVQNEQADIWGETPNFDA